MGSLLESPIIEKQTKFLSNKRLRYATSCMQGMLNFFRINDHNFIGWRATMEDSHIEYIDENNDIYVFGVFDGHGGFTIIFCFCLNYIQEKRLHFLCKNILFQNY